MTNPQPPPPNSEIKPLAQFEKPRQLISKMDALSPSNPPADTAIGPTQLTKITLIPSCQKIAWLGRRGKNAKASPHGTMNQAETPGYRPNSAVGNCFTLAGNHFSLNFNIHSAPFFPFPVPPMTPPAQSKLLSAKKNILIFPCGSEIGLEIHRSLKFSTHFNIVGGSSTDDHGKFIYNSYIGNIPFHRDVHFVDAINKVIIDNRIDAIYPTMDAVASSLKNDEEILACRVIGSPARSNQVCASKRLTYQTLAAVVPVPEIYTSIEDVRIYPVFIKPDEGYGSRNVFLARDKTSAEWFLNDLKNKGNFLICQHLPGEEYTIDCFSDRNGKLLFSGNRKRARIANGISVNTKPTRDYEQLFCQYADALNRALKPRGAWFFQMKADADNHPKLLEVAMRLAGSSSLFRSQGVNFAMLTLHDHFDSDVEILQNLYSVELDRALSNKYKFNLEYQNIYIDLDDCLLLGDKVNYEMVAFLYYARNHGKNLILITKHLGDLDSTLKSCRLERLFDQIIHLPKSEKKSDYVLLKNSIFIDDSHAERTDVKRAHGIPVFSIDMIEGLIQPS